MTLNNTEWRNPPGVSSDSSCSLIITLDRDLVEQRGPTCQVRYGSLDEIALGSIDFTFCWFNYCNRHALAND